MISMLRQAWLSEDSPYGRRVKRFIASNVPRPLLLAAKKRYYAALIKNPKTPREADMEALNLLIRPGDFALDIGAFVGFYTQHLSHLVGATGEVWAFEPVPETFAVLSYVVRELSLNNVRAFNFALSDSEGDAIMEIPARRRELVRREHSLETIATTSSSDSDTTTGARFCAFRPPSSALHEVRRRVS
jgi:FkbM family methyltransferase